MLAALTFKGNPVGLNELPENLPVPQDDGAANHLEGTSWPDVSFNSTNQEQTNLRELKGSIVLYVYPMTGRPDTALPEGWDGIPGARGCTPQSCSFRDHHSELQELNAQVYGLSSQTTEYQLEARERLHLPFNLLSDSGFQLKKKLKLPTFEVEGKELYKRITIILRQNVIVKVFYPVFPPGENADNVISWLRENA